VSGTVSRFAGRVALVTGGASGICAATARGPVAGAILYLASTDADWVTGVALPVDGGFLAA